MKGEKKMNLLCFLIFAFCKKIKEIYDLCLFKSDARKEHVLINSHFLIIIGFSCRQCAQLLESWLLTKFSISFSPMNDIQRTKLKEWFVTFIHSAGKIKPFFQPRSTNEILRLRTEWACKQRTPIKKKKIIILLEFKKNILNKQTNRKNSSASVNFSKTS